MVQINAAGGLIPAAFFVVFENGRKVNADAVLKPFSALFATTAHFLLR
jgi:hypothetical protein